jgi:hypothetical protein
MNYIILKVKGIFVSRLCNRYLECMNSVWSLEQVMFLAVQFNAVLSPSRSIKNISDGNPYCFITECFN